MKLGQIARMLAGFMLFFTFSLGVPLVVSLREEGVETIEGWALGGTTVSFLVAIVVGLVAALLLWLAGRKSSTNLFRREGLAVVGLAWFLAGGLAATPFVWSGAISSPVNAYFEAMSGLTTTGATVLGTANIDIESLPQSILLWRSMLQWMGGIGIVLVFIVLLPSVGVTGSRLLSSEQIGMSDDAVRPRMAQQARQLLGLYALLTGSAALSYWLVGLSGFDAICHAFTTVATGGFSTHNSSVGGFQSLGVELVAVVFMFLAGCNFLLIISTLIQRGRATASSGLYRVEFRVYVGIIVVVSLVIALILFRQGPSGADSIGVVHDYRDFGRCLRDGVFQTVSLATGTGYANADFQSWPKPALYLIFVCMFIGGCTGSTTGGFKVFRVLVCAKLAGYVLRHFVRPRSVEKLRLGHNLIADRVVVGVLGLLLLWIATVTVGAFVLMLDPHLDFVSSVTASLSMMGCVGPAFGDVAAGGIDLGPYAGYGELHPGAKIFMSVQMVLGRLEILLPLALLTPGFWRR